MNSDRPQSSALVDLNDPIQVHLLIETALHDSKQFEILSQEEVDDLKKQCQSLTQRIESTRQNLTMQSKYRDAAISMTRLYSHGKSGEGRRSLLGRNSGDHARAKEADAERQTCERMCEELAAELFNLEKRLMEPQRRLLQHTAGILQLTHKASKKKEATPPGQLVNGIPGSPESLYTYTRNSMDRAVDDDYLDDDYQFGKLDATQTMGLPHQNAIETPLKSPMREQNSQLREEMERVKEENAQLQNQSDNFVRSISDMELRLENLNGSLREAIVRFDPSRNDEYMDPPDGARNMEPGDMLRYQLDYLETGLVAIQAEQEESSGNKANDDKVVQQVESLNRQVRDILLTVDSDYPPTPHPQADLDTQLAYLESSLRATDSELERALQAATPDMPRNLDSDRMETTLKNLWNIIQSGFANIKQQKEERRRARRDKGLEEEQISEDELDIEEAYTLTGFSNRVQWLYAQATTLKDQKSVLQRQIKQQRELNNQSDAEKDEEIRTRQEELEENRMLLARAERDAMYAQTMLSETLEELEQTRTSAHNIASPRSQSDESSNNISALEADVKRLQTDLASAASAAGAAHAQIEERDDRIAGMEADVKRLQTDLASAASAAGAAHAQIEERDDRIAEMEADLKQLKSDLAVAASLAAATQSHIEDRDEKIAALEAELEYVETAQAQIEERNVKIANLQNELQQVGTTQIQVEERNAKISILEAELEQASAAQSQLEERTARMATLEAELEQANVAQSRLDERNARVRTLEADMELLQADLAGAAGAAGQAQAQLEERNSKIEALEEDIKQLQINLTAAQSSSKGNQDQLAGVDSVIGALTMQMDEASKARDNAEQRGRTLQQQVNTQKEDLASAKKALKAKEDDLELLNMNLIEMKTELTIAQAELDGAYGTRAERAADVAAIKGNAEVEKLQNQIRRLKNELSGTVQELEEVTKETLGSEREKMELESKLDDAFMAKASLEGEIATIRQRLEAEVEEAREGISKLQEELDGERLKAIPPNGGTGRGASMLSEQFRTMMREERRKFQGNIKVCRTLSGIVRRDD